MPPPFRNAGPYWRERNSTPLLRRQLHSSAASGFWCMPRQPRPARQNPTLVHKDSEFSTRPHEEFVHVHRERRHTFVASATNRDGLAGLNRGCPTLKWRKRRRARVSGNFVDTPYVYRSDEKTFGWMFLQGVFFICFIVLLINRCTIVYNLLGFYYRVNLEGFDDYRRHRLSDKDPA